jgi:hypothetical protein
VRSRSAVAPGGQASAATLSLHDPVTLAARPGQERRSWRPARCSRVKAGVV